MHQGSQRTVRSVGEVREFRGVHDREERNGS